ncbi:MAG: methyltransferase domain-containing protein [Elusimicrobia bacterium]|nr:methyltransferase domain-containing protein [Elusimicrobiota bacterium]
MIFRTPRRSAEIERLDSHDATDAELDQILDFHHLVGRATGGYSIVVRFLRAAIARSTESSAPVSVLDLGCGRGDLARAIAEWGHLRGVEIRVHGTDKYGRLIQMARARHKRSADLTFETRDLNDPFFLQAQQFDFVVSEMALHREDDARTALFLKTANRLARRGLIIVDWMRDRRALMWVGMLARLGRPEIVRRDARTAVERGFSLEEADKLRESAGLEFAAVRAHVGYRFSISGERALALRPALSPVTGLLGA